MNLYKLLAFVPFAGKRAGPEDVLALEVGSQLRAWSLTGRLRCAWTHVPHELGGGGPAAKVRVAMAKAMGLIAGSGDYVFAGEGFGAFIELKAPTGSLNPAQKLYREWCQGLNVPYSVCRSMAEVEAVLIGWGMLV